MSANVKILGPVAAARHLSQTDPTENLARAIGADVTRAKSILADLERALALLDGNRELLRKRGIIIDVDLGDVGNAAAAARRLVEGKKGKTTFRMPS